jgi:excisionase family DNA binding protein
MGVDSSNVETPPVRRLTLTVGEASQVLGVSRSYAYELVRRGELPCMRLGRRIVIPVRALDALLDRVTTEATG